MASKKRHPPILDTRGPGPAYIEPSRLMARLPRLPKRAVLCFFYDILDEWRRSGRLVRETDLPGEGPPLVVLRHAHEPLVAVAFPGVGAPLASATLEEMIALGVEIVACIGGAGVLVEGLPVGQLMLPTEALRDEGTSYHYQQRGRFARPDPSVVGALRRAAKLRGLPARSVRVWTTDAPYRETHEVVERRRAEGCHAVEMEAAALFAVARFRGIRLACLLYAGDDLSGPEWRHRRWLAQREVRETMLEVALDAVRSLDT